MKKKLIVTVIILALIILMLCHYSLVEVQESLPDEVRLGQLRSALL